MNIKRNMVYSLVVLVCFIMVSFVGTGNLQAAPPNVKKANLGTAWDVFLQGAKKDAKAQGTNKFTAILFDKNLEVIHTNQTTGISGELIYVGVLKVKKETGYYFEVDFQPCSLQKSAPSILISNKPQPANPATGDINLAAVEKMGVTIERFPPQRCYNNSSNITVKKVQVAANGTKKTLLSGHFSLQQYKRYRATLHVGILASKLADQTFAVDPGNSKIYNAGPVGTDPQYFSALVIYGLPHYLKGIFSSKTRYRGRDPLHENSFLDRIGGVVGVGLKKPTKRFFIGLSFEVAYGMNLIGGVEYAGINELAGVKVGDTFSGTPPVTLKWKHKFVLGFSFDLKYISHLTKSGTL